MRTQFSVLLPALLCMSFHASLAHAQATGLRLKNHTEGITLHSTESGLRLQYIAPSRLGNEPAATQSAASIDWNTPTLRNSLRADWPVLSKGFHSTLGVSWNAQENSLSSSNTPKLNPTPFLGLDWQSSAPSSKRWKLSAEIGTALSGGKACPSMATHCSNAQSTGFNPQSSGSGLRLNPYVNFGATFSFDQ